MPEVFIRRNRTGKSSFIDISREKLHRNIFLLSWPAVSEHLLYTITMLVDMIMVSKLGTNSIAAVGVSNIMSFIFISIFGFPLRIAAQAITARFAGKNNMAKIKEVGGNTLFLSLSVGSLISLTGILGSRMLLHIMGTSEPVTMIGKTYLSIVLGIAMFRFLYYVCSGILRGMGDTRTPMFIMIFANIFNVIFNYFLIFGIGIFPELGVIGAGIATGGSYILAGLIIFTVTIYFREGIPVTIGDIRKLNRGMIKNIIRVSLPAAIETAVRRGGLFVFMKMVTAVGTVALAAHQLTVRIEAFSFMIGVGFGVAANTLSGQSLGAGDPELAEESIKKTSYYALLIMTGLAFFFVLNPGLVFKIFNPEPTVRLFGIMALMICAFEQIPIGIFMVVTGGLKGAGDTKTPMFISFIGSIVVRLPLAYIFAFKMDYGFAGIWLAAVIDWTVKAILSVIALYRDGWKKVEFE